MAGRSTQSLDFMRIVYFAYATIVIAVLALMGSPEQWKELAFRVIMVLWVGAFATMLLRWRRAEWLALVAFAPILAVLLMQTASRVGFVVEHRGMDCATCNSSPLAFLLGWSLELAFLVPAVVLCVWLWRTVRPKGRA